MAGRILQFDIKVIDLTTFVIEYSVVKYLPKHLVLNAFPGPLIVKAMKNLTTYVDSCINLRLTDINNINQKIADRIFDSLDGDLSPENLCCDGEIGAAAARRQEKFLYKAGYELLKLGFKPSNTWSQFALRLTNPRTLV